jgi:hypothetical protein
MNIASLTVTGDCTSLDAIRQTLPEKPESEWVKGDARRNGRVYEDSGFDLTIADVETPGELVEKVRAYLAVCRVRGLTFAVPSISAELRVGFSVGDSRQFIGSVDFSLSDLRDFAELGIGLSVTAYPTSDEANSNG